MDFLVFVLFVLAYIAIMRFLLPRLGVQT
jgi:hypothetical protein